MRPSTLWLISAIALSTLAGCNKPRDASFADQAAVANLKAPPADKAPAVPAVSVPMLAYSYTYGLLTPPKAIPDLLARHQKACLDAGPAVCQVTGSSISQADDSGIQGRLTLRAAPAWLTAFRAHMSDDARAAGGRLSDSETQTEDLTRQIVDTEAAERARSTLRDRLQAILATRPGKLSDLLEVERELARVQGELDATQSELTVMRTRVATSLMTITYQSTTGLMAPRGAWAPLVQAMRGVSNILATTLGAMVTLFVAILPWAALAGVAYWLVRGPLRRVFKKPPAV